MALRKPNEMLAAFSMASMTDVIFLLLVFFMVTSTYVFPTAIEVNLPEGTEQTPEKPSTRIFIDSEGAYFVSVADAEPAPVPKDSLVAVLTTLQGADSVAGIAVYADVEVQYGKVVEVLNLGAANSLKMVLATRPSATQASADEQTQQSESTAQQ
ncbi:MAG: biopolymer transporter ExbD [Muribaculaceae bacterium]|nr:biopolymer transporter ExbD [Muribaculaceae bacterium]